jgi:hypothetical protein
MQLVAALAFGLVLFGAVALIATMLRAEAARVIAVLSGQELARARTPRAVTVVTGTAWRRARAARLQSRAQPLAAAA